MRSYKYTLFEISIYFGTWNWCGFFCVGISYLCLSFCCVAIVNKEMKRVSAIYEKAEETLYNDANFKLVKLKLK